MRTHIDNLILIVPDLLKRKIVDIGSGKGSFLMELAKRGVSAIGIEPTPEYIALSRAAGRRSGYMLEVIQGTAEHIPLPDSSVGFVNIGEVIEHVEDPEQLLVEMYRILQPGGRGYLSVPNRFGLKDQHFHMYFINWMPRTWAHALIGLRNRHKDYSGKAGRQSLLAMHYYTYAKIQELCREKGFEVSDIRVEKIKRMYGIFAQFFLIPIYSLLRVFYWDAFHLLLEKK
jgi:ubiquinone/menaquinone biosynthesis C-methylase UbiE